MSMGWAEAEREEHMEYMRQRDIEAGHKPGCSISVPPNEGGGYCDCGVFPRGVSRYDPEYEKPSRRSQSKDFFAMAFVFFIGFVAGLFCFAIMIFFLNWWML